MIGSIERERGVHRGYRNRDKEAREGLGQDKDKKGGGSTVEGGLPVATSVPWARNCCADQELVPCCESPLSRKKKRGN